VDPLQYFNISCEFLVFMTDDFFPHHVIECVQIVFVDDTLYISDVVEQISASNLKNCCRENSA
jgi:hypothetical protein